MTDEEFTQKLQSLLLGLNELYDTSQWNILCRVALDEGSYDLDDALRAILTAERFINPYEEGESPLLRIERLKAQSQRA